MRNIVFIFILISITFCAVNAAKCEDVAGKITKVCKDDDQDCKAALGTLIQCLQICEGNTSDDEKRACAKSNCSKITNSTVKSYYNDLINCSISFDSVLLFSALFVLIALLF